MKRFLDAYGKDMEFCQIQLNWLDWNFQNAQAKVELLREWNIPVWVMEPVRGRQPDEAVRREPCQAARAASRTGRRRNGRSASCRESRA